MKSKESVLARLEFASKRYLRSIGGATSCYPMGKGVALFADESAGDARRKAEADGWSLDPVPGVGRDMNFGGRLYRASRLKRA